MKTYHLTPLQQGMVFHHVSARGCDPYARQFVCRLPEVVAVETMAKAWAAVAARHEVLRTAVVTGTDGKLTQVVIPAAQVPFQQSDWRNVSDAIQAERRAAFLQQDWERGFALESAPLLRVALFRLGETEYEMVVTFHHVVLDGRSLLTVIREVFAVYEALQRGETIELPPVRPFSDHVEWLQRQDFSQAKTFWRQTLHGFSALTPLNIDRSAAGRNDVTGYGERETKLSSELTTRLVALGAAHGLTLNTLVQGAWAVLLSRYSGEHDVVFGGIRACRHSGVDGGEAMVGMLINTVPVRAQVDPDLQLIPFLQQLRTLWTAMRPYEHAPLSLIQKWSALGTGNPLFASLVVCEGCLLGERLQAQGGAWSRRQFRFQQLTTSFPLTINGFGSEQLGLRIVFDRSLFTDATIEKTVGHLETVLEAMAANPDQRLGELPILRTAERQQLLVEWNATAVDYPADAVLHGLLEAQVARTPDAVAVVADGGSLTYRDLDKRANQLAYHLRNRGVGRDTLVGVCLERSLEMVVALYGVLKAGAAYVPIDPDHPRDRVRYMLEDAATPVLLTQAHLLERLDGVPAVCLDRDWDQISRQPDYKPAERATADTLAYMIYTSGSTGKPKGALNTHRGICNRLLWMQDQYQLTSTDVVLQKTPFSFDVSVWEFFWPLLTGARLVVARPGGHRDPDYLINLIEQQQVTVLHFVPSMLRQFLETPGVERCRSLREVICSGEALPWELQQRFFELLPARLHNLYGPTEAAVDVTHWTCQRSGGWPGIVPIGQPVANTQTYILDARLAPVPIGVPGELHLGGVQVGRGYHNRLDLTAEKFIPDPFSTRDGARLYKTGDRARYLPDGNIEYLGRLDFQVKIRGQRIELGEIECQLAAHPAVRQVVVLARTDGADEPRLVAYLVSDNGATPAAPELRSFLGQNLPEYMVPAAFVWLPQLPLSHNGKVDRRALPAPELPAPQAHVPPRTELERTLAGIWQAVLRVETVSVEDNFFELGGHSLRLLKVQVRLQRELQRPIAVTELFQYPTIRALAAFLEQPAAYMQNRQQSIRARAQQMRAAII